MGQENVSTRLFSRVMGHKIVSRGCFSNYGRKNISIMLFPAFMREKNVSIILFPPVMGEKNVSARLFPNYRTEKRQYLALSQL